MDPFEKAEAYTHQISGGSLCEGQTRALDCRNSGREENDWIEQQDVGKVHFHLSSDAGC